MPNSIEWHPAQGGKSAAPPILQNSGTLFNRAQAEFGGLFFNLLYSSGGQF
jgi:hypothetical protein